MTSTFEDRPNDYFCGKKTTRLIIKITTLLRRQILHISYLDLRTITFKLQEVC